MLSVAKPLYQKVSYCSTQSLNSSTHQINVRTGWSVLKKKKESVILPGFLFVGLRFSLLLVWFLFDCLLLLFFCSSSYTVISHQFINSSAHKEKPKETVSSSGEKKRGEGICAAGKEDCFSYRRSSKLALPAQVCITGVRYREHHELLPCSHFHVPFGRQKSFAVAPRVSQQGARMSLGTPRAPPKPTRTRHVENNA